MAKLPLHREYPSYCCPYCGKEVGWVGRALAALFGAQFHGCDFSNVIRSTDLLQFLYDKDGK